MRATLTRYSVPGWGDGELWLRDRVVLAHDFSYLDSEGTDGGGERVGPRASDRVGPRASDRVGPRPPKGVASPPTGTLVANPSQGGHGSVPTLHQENGPDPRTPAGDLVVRIADFLAGSDVPLDDVELDFSWTTPFQHAVADALRRIPRGEVVTYGELAALAGHPGAARAVGSFCAHNRFALLVPCHRVVGAAGLGGYGATGLAVKRRLLALEGVVP